MPTEVLRGARKGGGSKGWGLANPTGHFRRRVRAVAFSTQWEPPTSIQRRSARKLSFLGPRLCDDFRVCVSAELRAFPASLARARGSGEGGSRKHRCASMKNEGMPQGMGTVYESLQLSTGKMLALKIMHTQCEGDDRTRLRFSAGGPGQRRGRERLHRGDGRGHC